MQPKCRGDKIEQQRCFIRGGNKQKLLVYYWSQKPKAIIHDARSVGNKFVSKFLRDQNRGWSDELEPTQWNVVLIFLLCVPQPFVLILHRIEKDNRGDATVAMENEGRLYKQADLHEPRQRAEKGAPIQ